jgi:hypothetical protein
MNRFVSLGFASVLLVAIAALSLPARASAEERPHSLRGTAQFVSPAGDFVGEGYATHLGYYAEVGNASISPTGVVTAWAHFTSGNGHSDELFELITGQIYPDGSIIATITYVGGTGRFEDASGSATLLGQLLPGGRIEVAVEGTIDY